jgi:hypothetical protein
MGIEDQRGKGKKNGEKGKGESCSQPPRLTVLLRWTRSSNGDGEALSTMPDITIIATR